MISLVPVQPLRVSFAIVTRPTTPASLRLGSRLLPGTGVMAVACDAAGDVGVAGSVVSAGGVEVAATAVGGTCVATDAPGLAIDELGGG